MWDLVGNPEDRFSRVAVYSYLLKREVSVAQWLCHSPCKPGVAGLILDFSSLSDETITKVPILI